MWHENVGSLPFDPAQQPQREMEKRGRGPPSPQSSPETHPREGGDHLVSVPPAVTCMGADNSTAVCQPGGWNAHMVEGAEAQFRMSHCRLGRYYLKLHLCASLIIH